MAEPWERLRFESSKAYAAFCAYRDLGPDRSIVKAAEGTESSPKVRQFKKWSSRNRWVSRAEAYDDEMDRQLRARNEKARKEMADRHAKMAVLGQGTVLDAFRRIKAEDLTPSQAVRWLETLVKIERLSRGEPTEIQKSEHAGTLDIAARYRAMTPDERRIEMIRIFREELGKKEEEAEALVNQVIGAKLVGPSPGP
jgi:hypothetical protein